MTMPVRDDLDGVEVGRPILTMGKNSPPSGDPGLDAMKTGKGGGLSINRHYVSRPCNQGLTALTSHHGGLYLRLNESKLPAKLLLSGYFTTAKGKEAEMWGTKRGEGEERHSNNIMCL